MLINKASLKMTIFWVHRIESPIFEAVKRQMPVLPLFAVYLAKLIICVDGCVLAGTNPTFCQDGQSMTTM